MPALLSRPVPYATEVERELFDEYPDWLFKPACQNSVTILRLILFWHPLVVFAIMDANSIVSDPILESFFFDKRRHGVSKTPTTEETVYEIHDLVLADRRI